MKYVFKLIFPESELLQGPDGTVIPLFTSRNTRIKSHFAKLKKETYIPILTKDLDSKDTGISKADILGKYANISDLKTISKDVPCELVFLDLSRIDENPIFSLDIYDPLRLYEDLTPKDIHYNIGHTIIETFRPIDNYIDFYVQIVPKLDELIPVNNVEDNSKQSCNFKFPKEIYDLLRELSEKNYLSMTDYLIQLLLREKTPMSGTSGRETGH